MVQFCFSIQHYIWVLKLFPVVRKGKDGKDGRGLKLEKNGGFNAMSFKNLQKYSYGYYSQLKLFEYG